jgi:Zn-dependent peptidase ImmA (M78 family)
MAAASRVTHITIARDLLGLIEDDVLEDLRSEDIVAAVETHFSPVRVKAMPATEMVGTESCATDGFYEAVIDSERPWILYADDVAPSRARFTIIHELGHHLLVNQGASLLDHIDGLGSDAVGAEEQVCHQFAGLVLISDALVGNEELTPEHVLRVKEASGASWEATAVRLAGAAIDPVAVVLVREEGKVAFATGSPSLGSAWWPRGSDLDPHGPLWNATLRSIRAQPDTYRFGLGGAQRLFVDSLRAHQDLAVAVLRRTPSDGHFEVLENPEPVWRDRALTCLFCPGERSSGWCELCLGQHCHDCGRCACSGAPVEHARCPACGRSEAHRPGADLCRTCEADLA